MKKKEVRGIKLSMKQLEALIKGFKILKVMEQKNEAFVTEISTATGVFPYSTIRKLNELEKAGFVEVSGYRTLGRGVRKYYKLTELGSEALKKIKSLVSEA